MVSSLKEKLPFKDRVLPLVWFLSTTGYYLIMMFFFKLGFASQSRLFTVPVRLVPLLIGIWAIIKYKTIIFNNRFLGFLWLFVYVVYISRMYFDVFFLDIPLFMSASNYLMFAFSHFVIPPLFLSIMFHEKAWESAKHWVMIPAVLVSLLGYFWYKDILASSLTGRIGGTSGENVSLAPLAIAYTCAIPIAYYTLTLIRKNSLKSKIWATLIIAASFPGLLLGGSRGPILAYVIAIILISLCKKFKGRLVLFGIMITFSLPLLLSLSESFGSATFGRVFNTISETESGEYLDQDRPYLWKNALQNFVNHPFIGDLIENRGIGHHPHNIIIEAFMAMGILGGIPFLIIFVFLFKMAFKIAKSTDKFDWVLIVFFMSFSQNMVSGAIWGAIWLWTSAGSVMSIYYMLQYIPPLKVLTTTK